MHIGKINENEQREYYMTKNNQRRSIITIQEEKDLGVTIDNQMKFVSHIIQASVKKANRNLGIIKRTFSYIDKTVFLNLYKALVRPHLEYGSTV